MQRATAWVTSIGSLCKYFTTFKLTKALCEFTMSCPVLLAELTETRQSVPKRKLKKQNKKETFLFLLAVARSWHLPPSVLAKKIPLSLFVFWSWDYSPLPFPFYRRPLLTPPSLAGGRAVIRTKYFQRTGGVQRWGRGLADGGGCVQRGCWRRARCKRKKNFEKNVAGEKTR